MGARLRGLDEGRKKDDPLRMEIDKIRSKLVELKKLQASKIPVLWRPLHEAGGKWFWWGAKTSTAAK